MRVGARVAERYVITGELGAGGMGVVVRARDERLGRAVAMKLLSPQTLGDEAARARLMREARAVAALDHPNIVHVYDVGETEDGGAYLVMELVAGKSLREHLEGGTLTRKQRLGAVIDVASALAFAHKRGFVHRDVKPDNVMIREDGRAVVLDFGLAKTVAFDLATTVDAVNVTADGSFVGTPAYAAPEQMRGEPSDPKTDQFALAVMAFELMSDRLPWKGSSALEVISEILKGEAIREDALDASIPASARRAIARGLDKDASRRFGDIETFAAELSGALASTEEPRSRPRDATRTFAEARTAPASIVSAPAPTRARRPWLFGVAAFVALGGAAILWSRAQRPSSVPPPSSSSAPSAASASPLAAEASVIGCPVLDASDTAGARSGWLGAATAALVCQRAQLMLGGDPARTLVPAELLGLPREPNEDFPRYSFEAPETRAKTLAAAKSRAAAYVDGKVAHDGDFRVSLSLVRSGDGATLMKGEARAPVLLDAVRDAMATIRPGLPTPAATPLLADWWLGASVDAALELHDLHVSIINEDDDSIRAHCERARARTDLGGLRAFTEALCADKLYLPSPAPPSVDTGSAAALLTSVASLRFAPTLDDVARKAQLDRVKLVTDAAAKEPSSFGKSLLLSVAAETSYQALNDLAKSADEARASIQASPKLVDLRGNAWHRQAFATNGNNVHVLYAHAAWLPWESFALSNLSRLTEEDKTGKPSVEGVRCAALMGHSGYWPRMYGEFLVQSGKLEAATSVAVELDSDYLRALIAHSEHRPKQALELLTSALAKLPARPENGGLASRYAVMALELANFLGVETTAPTDYYERFVAAEPPALTRGIVTLFGSVVVCAALEKPAAGVCLDRMQKLFSAGYFGAAFRGAKELMEAERRAQAGDAKGAAEACRPLVAEGFVVELVQGAVVRLLGAGGLDELAEKLDNGAIAQGNMLPTADMAYARAAIRAQKKGDTATAKKLAAAFVDRWEAADRVPSILPEMQKLAAGK